MSSFPGTPRVARGALVSINLPTPIPHVVIFQYNPDTLTRTLQPQMTSGGENRSEAFRLRGAPIETISFDIELDATDQLEHPDQNPITTATGILPQLAALEIALYPSTVQVIANAALAAVGTIEVVPPQGPFTVFIWGAKRILPVRLTSYRVSEEAHDTSLNPIRAKVSLELRVLTYDDLDISNPGYWLFLAHQVTKEAMAAIGSVSSVSSVISGSVSL